MRIKICFRLKGNKQVLPLNYQYPMSAWIYKILAKGDAELASVMHQEGYQLENGKTFKLFTFSQLRFPAHSYRVIPKTDRMELWARKGWLSIAFQFPQPAEKFVLGLFRNQQVEIGDKISTIGMEVESVELEPNPEITNREVFIRSLSPIVIGENKPGSFHETYLSPLDDHYERLFFRNLLDKHRLISRTDATAEQLLEANKLTFTCLSQKPKQKLQVIKAHTPDEVKVRGYLFEFKLMAPDYLIKVGLNSGFGSMNAMGFGFGEINNLDRVTSAQRNEIPSQ